jgi:Putative motility protein
MDAVSGAGNGGGTAQVAVDMVMLKQSHDLMKQQSAALLAALPPPPPSPPGVGSQVDIRA